MGSEMCIRDSSNTPRQIFILEGLGFDRPVYAHIPSVAAPGSKSKLSKRKIEQYFSNKDFKNLFDDGAAVADQIGLDHSPLTFNPVLVEFYEKTGFLPDAIINYLALLGWALDGETEDFTPDDLIKNFSLAGVNNCLLYTSPSPRDLSTSRMPSSA